MLNGQRFSFTERQNDLGESSILPYVPLILTAGDRSMEVMALLDTGASVSVLPYELGLELGMVWENQTVVIPLSGNLAQSEARGVVLSGSIGQFAPVLLAFAWTERPNTPMILGHMNFFAEFNACFYRHELTFELRPK
jgi:hypothetical protein